MQDEIRQALLRMGLELDLVDSLSTELVSEMRGINTSQVADIIDELLHIYHGDGIRNYGMLKRDMLYPELSDDLRDYGLIEDVLWKSQTNYDMIRTTEKGQGIATKIANAILESSDLSSIDGISIIAAWLESYAIGEYETDSPKVNVGSLSKEYRFFSVPETIFPYLGEYSDWFHNLAKRGFIAFRRKKLSAEVSNYVATKRGELRDRYLVMDKSTATVIADRVSSKIRKRIFESVENLWASYRARFLAIRYLLNITSSPTYAPIEIRDDAKEIFSNTFSSMKELSLSLEESVLRGEGRLDLEDEQPYRKHLDAVRKDLGDEFEQELGVLLQELDQELGQEVTSEPEHETAIREESSRKQMILLGALKSTPRLSWNQMSKIADASVDETKRLVFELIAQDKITGHYEETDEQFISLSALRVIEEATPNGLRMNVCVNCGKPLPAGIRVGDRIVCPACGEENLA